MVVLARDFSVTSVAFLSTKGSMGVLQIKDKKERNLDVQ